MSYSVHKMLEQYAIHLASSHRPALIYYLAPAPYRCVWASPSLPVWLCLWKAYVEEVGSSGKVCLSEKVVIFTAEAGAVKVLGCYHSRRVLRSYHQRCEPSRRAINACAINACAINACAINACVINACAAKTCTIKAGIIKVDSRSSCQGGCRHLEADQRRIKPHFRSRFCSFCLWLS